MNIKKHTVLTITVILISLVFSLPDIYFISKADSNAPLTINNRLAYMEEETYIYAAHVQQMLSGYFRGDPYLWEYRKSPSPYLGETASIIPIAFLSFISQSVPIGFLLADMIFPALLFLLIYIFLRKLKFSQGFSIVASIAVISVPFLSLLLPKISSYGTQLTGDLDNAIFFSRTPHPQISAIYLFGSLFFTAMILKKPAPKLIYAWAVLIGVSVYSSPFISSTIALGTLFITPFLLGKTNIKVLAKAFLLVLFIASPVIYNVGELQKYLATSDFLLRTTFPIQLLFPRQLRYILVALLLFKFRKDALSYTLIVYILAASILSDGHQILSGRNLEADHWITRVLAPITTLSLFLLIEKFIVNFKLKTNNVFWFSIGAILILIAFSKQIVWMNANKEHLTPDPSLERLITLVNYNTKQDAVIGSLDPLISKHITGLTGKRVYLAPGDRTLASSAEQIQRICDLISLSVKDKDQTISRALLNYSLGFNVWFASDVSSYENKIKECQKGSTIKPKYKLDYIVQKNETLNTWQLIPIK